VKARISTNPHSMGKLEILRDGWIVATCPFKQEDDCDWGCPLMTINEDPPPEGKKYSSTIFLSCGGNSVMYYKEEK